MNKVLFALIVTAAGLFLSFVLLEASLSYGGHDFLNSFSIPIDRIESSFLGNVIDLNEIPPGFYAWQSGTSHDGLFNNNKGLDRLIDIGEFYKNFKFFEKKGAWIKFIITAEQRIVFTSSGLISASGSNNLDVLEIISNKIKTSFDESKKIKLIPRDDLSTYNISAAIYNALKDKMSVGEALDFSNELLSGGYLDTFESELTRSALKGATVRNIYMSGKSRGIYCETFLPGYFDKVKIAFVIKNTFHIARIFILSSKKNYFISGGVKNEDFISSFSGLLIGDINVSDINIYKQSGARIEAYTSRYKVIKYMSDIFPLVKKYISRSRD